MLFTPVEHVSDPEQAPVVSSYPHEGLVLAAGRLSVLGPDATGRDVGRAIDVEVEASWEDLLVLYVGTEVILQLCEIKRAKVA